MKKILITFLLSMFLTPAFAAEYLLYDVQKNSTSTAILFTYSVYAYNTYKIGFSNQFAICGNLTFEKYNGLIGGTCNDLNENLFYWKETEPNTFLNEVNEIIIERREENMKIDNGQLNSIKSLME